ncbi:MAG: hypothetical protein JW943_07480 [Deltaproteobacteria bacterium]|nr:hypothetical protein [Deltaproteobacteria bacterium]
MKKKSVFIFVLTLLFIFSAVSLSGEFWASKNSNKYHYPTCRWAKKIYPQNLIKFSSPEEAIKAGYVPCKVCKPPISSRSDVNDNNLIVAKVNIPVDPQRRGCCSHHGGVCGCQDGRALCCDGTVSPSCGCD